MGQETFEFDMLPASLQQSKTVEEDIVADLHDKLNGIVKGKSGAKYSWRGNGRPIFRWEEVLSCMESGSIFYTEKECDCHAKLIAVYFRSQFLHMNYPFGIDGVLYICPKCMKQISFEDSGKVRL